MVEPSDPRVLILETSGRIGEVALARGAKIVRHRLLDETRLHARDLAPAVAAMLEEEARRPAEIQLVIVNRGPGSYTGLRVGIMSAKAFAYATGAAIIAVEGFSAVANQTPKDANQVDVIADAQRGLIYQQRFIRSAENGKIKSASELRIVDIANWIQKLAPGSWVSGPGVRKFAERLPGHLQIPSEKAWDPHPASNLESGLVRYWAGERDDPWKLEPLYLRPSSAEEKWAALDQ